MRFILLILLLAAAQSNTPWERPEIMGCQNVFQISETVYSGSEPHGEEALKALADRGIKTIVSVDGARPDVETARKYGIRYIHLPIGYDGIPAERGLQYGLILKNVEAPIYFHCHHGKHRGPAAAAAGMEAAGQWNPETASAFLEAAGTSPKYKGLYQYIRDFKPPSETDLAKVDTRFPETADLPASQESMAMLDRRKDNLTLAAEAGWDTPPEHPDISPAHEALQVREILTELKRLPETTARPPQYQSLLDAALGHATALETALSAGNRDAAATAFGALNGSCATCHDAYRE